MVKSYKLQASTNRGASGGREAPSRKPQAGLDKAVALGYSGIMENKKITMWWNLPPEELDEVIEANDGKLEPFTHVEEDETIQNRR